MQKKKLTIIIQQNYLGSHIPTFYAQQTSTNIYITHFSVWYYLISDNMCSSTVNI